MLPGQLRTPRGHTPPDQQPSQAACEGNRTTWHWKGAGHPNPLPPSCRSHCGRLGAMSEPGGTADKPLANGSRTQARGAAAPSVRPQISNVLSVARNSPVGQGQDLGGQGAWQGFVSPVGCAGSFPAPHPRVESGAVLLVHLLGRRLPPTTQDHPESGPIRSCCHPHPPCRSRWLSGHPRAVFPGPPARSPVIRRTAVSARQPFLMGQASPPLPRCLLLRSRGVRPPTPSRTPACESLLPCDSPQGQAEQQLLSHTFLLPSPHSSSSTWGLLWRLLGDAGGGTERATPTHSSQTRTHARVVYRVQTHAHTRTRTHTDAHVHTPTHASPPEGLLVLLSPSSSRGASLARTGTPDL